MSQAFLGEYDDEADIPTKVFKRTKEVRLTKPDAYIIVYGGAVGLFGAILLMCGYMLYRVMFG